MRFFGDEVSDNVHTEVDKTAACLILLIEMESSGLLGNSSSLLYEIIIL